MGCVRCGVCVGDLSSFQHINEQTSFFNQDSINGES